MCLVPDWRDLQAANLRQLWLLWRERTSALEHEAGGFAAEIAAAMHCGWDDTCGQFPSQLRRSRYHVSFKAPISESAFWHVDVEFFFVCGSEPRSSFSLSAVVRQDAAGLAKIFRREKRASVLTCGVPALQTQHTETDKA